MVTTRLFLATCEILARTHPPSTRGGEEPQGLWVLSPVVFMYAKQSVLGWVSLEENEKPGGVATRAQNHGQRSGSQNALEDGNSYGFGAS